MPRRETTQVAVVRFSKAWRQAKEDFLVTGAEEGNEEADIARGVLHMLSKPFVGCAAKFVRLI